MNIKLIFAAIIMLSFGIDAQAQMAQTSKFQHNRIRQGAGSGELTRAETAHLGRDQRNIRKNTRMAKSDGVITRGERKEICQDKRQASRKIYRKKHNQRDRG